MPASVFQVLKPDGTVAGTGFLTSRGIGFTCAHVVCAAGQSPGGHVDLCFPHLPDAPRARAHVTSEEWRAPEAEDIAGLRLDSVPAGAGGMAVGTSAGSRGHRVFSYGFPAQAPASGHFGYGEAGGLLPGSNGAGRLLQLSRANDLTTGFSGGPVVDEMTGLVIGMVTAIASPDPHLKGLGIAYATPAEVLREVRPRLAEHRACPYLGLEPFTAQHADWFHGREAAVERVLRVLGGERRILMLLGPSGAGKSSLVHAGVLPALAGGALPGSDRWLPLCVRPGQDLLTELEGAGLPGAATDGLVTAVETRLAAEPDRDRLLLVIDQFEELILQPFPAAHEGPGDGRRRAVDQLVALGGSRAAVTLLLVMRNDFYAPLDALAPDLMSAALPGLCNVPATLSRPELLAIITRPAASVGLRLEAGLADRIVGDVLDIDPVDRQAPVTLLPALELALRQLWMRRRADDGALTHAAYEKMGKVTGSLTAWCNRALGQLPDEQQPIARRVLTALVRPADEANGIPATRQPMALGRLRALATGQRLTGPAVDTAFDAVLAALTRYRIITTGTTTPPGASSGEPTAELIHDALIRGWADLRGWVAQDHRFQIWLRRATEQQARHARSGLPGDLLDGSLLAEGEKWAKQRSLPAETVALLAASRQRQQSAIRRARRINIALAGALVLALIAAGVAFQQRQTVIGQRNHAASAQVAGVAQSLRRTDPQLARRLAVASARLGDTPEAWSALLALRHQREDDVLRLPGFVVTTSDLDGAGRILVAAGGTHVGFWNTDTRRRIGLYKAPSPVRHVSLSADGKTATVSTADGNTRLLDVAGARPRGTRLYPSSRGEYWPRVALSPHGTYLLTEGIAADSQPTMAIWDTRTSKKIITTTGGTFPVWNTSFSPDERVLSLPRPSGKGKPFTWYDTRTRKKIPVPGFLVKAGYPSGPVVFSPDGRFVALTAGGGKIRVFDRTNDYFETDLEGGEDPSIYPISFSHDSRYLAQGGVLWEIRSFPATRETSYSITDGECFSGTGLKFTADSSELHCTGTDGAVRSFDITPFTKAPTPAERPYYQGAVSRDRSTFALVRGIGGDIEIWSPLTRTRRATITAGGQPNDIMLSPDGRRLAVLVALTKIEVWDLDQKRRLGTLPGPLDREQSNGAVLDAAFSPDNRSLAVQGITFGGDNVLAFWDLTTMSRIREVRAKLGNNGDGAAVFFTPSGERVLAAPNFGLVEFPSGRTVTKGAPNLQMNAISDDGAKVFTYPRGSWPYLRILDAHTLHPVQRDLFTGAISAWDGEATASSPDGRLFATVNKSGSEQVEIKVWDSRTRTQLGVALTGPPDDITGIAFTPDGSALTSVDKHGRFRTYAIAPARLIHDLCAASGPLTEQEWHTYIPDIPYRQTC